MSFEDDDGSRMMWVAISVPGEQCHDVLRVRAGCVGGMWSSEGGRTLRSRVCRDSGSVSSVVFMFDVLHLEDDLGSWFLRLATRLPVSSGHACFRSLST
jgi:hypothetical protein